VLKAYAQAHHVYVKQKTGREFHVCCFHDWKGISCLLLSWDGVFHFGKVFLRFAIVMKPGDSGVG
jgi:hypothetical protein